EAGALSYLLFTSFPTSADNSVEKVKFVDAKPVHFPEITQKWGNDNGGSAGWRTAAINDKDGSITGTPNTYVVNNIGLLGAFDGCEVKPTWGAAVCKGDIGRMNIGGGGGGFGGGGGRGAGPRAGGAGPGAGPGAAPRTGGPGAAGPGAGAPGGAPAGAAPRAGGPGGFGAAGAAAGAAAGPGGPPPGAGGFGGFGGAPGARGGAGAAPQPPVVLSRKGKEFTAAGEATVVAGTEIKVTTERATLPISI